MNRRTDDDSRRQASHCAASTLPEYVMEGNGAGRAPGREHRPGGRARSVGETMTTAGGAAAEPVRAASAGRASVPGLVADLALSRADRPLVVLAVETGDDAPHLARSAAAAVSRRSGAASGRVAVVTCRAERCPAPRRRPDACRGP